MHLTKWTLFRQIHGKLQLKLHFNSVTWILIDYFSFWTLMGIAFIMTSGFLACVINKYIWIFRFQGKIYTLEDDEWFWQLKNCFIELSRWRNQGFLLSYKDLLCSFCQKKIVMLSGAHPRIIRERNMRKWEKVCFKDILLFTFSKFLYSFFELKFK